MRDDIYKSAPVDRHWQTVLKRTLREADRGDRAIEAADAAVRRDVRTEAPEAFIRELAKRCSDPSADMFRSRFDDLPAGCTHHVLADALVARLRMFEAQGNVSSQTFEDALTQVLGERMRARETSLCGHVLKQRGHGQAECVRAVQAAVRAISPRDYARELISNAGRMAAPARHAPHLEEALPVHHD